MIYCAICGEFLAANEEELADNPHVGSGEIAEMFNPKAVHGRSGQILAIDGKPQDGVVHAQCGLSAGWEIS